MEVLRSHEVAYQNLDMFLESDSLIRKQMKLKLYINDRTYTKWSFTDNETNKDVPVEFCTSLQYIDPAVQKLFCKDVIEIIHGEGNEPRINFVHSYVKTCDYIAGVLVLEGNKTFGRTENKKRLLYKCVPDDHRLPIFLVPYDIKIGFSKVYKNKFVTFRFDKWSEKHPQGILLETLGDIDNLEAFYEYQLYCKNLHVPITDFTNRTRSTMTNKKTNDRGFAEPSGTFGSNLDRSLIGLERSGLVGAPKELNLESLRAPSVLKVEDLRSSDRRDSLAKPRSSIDVTKLCSVKSTEDEFVEQIFQNSHFQIEDRRSHYVFTIDPPNSLDFDDGFGIEHIGNKCWRISIYISNVFVWLETLGLWNSFSKRVATIYLPDRRRPMLPTILSDILCSLQQNQPRFALAMDIIVDDNGNLIENQPISYKNVLINVKKNYAYEDPKLLNNDAHYKQLFEVSYLMDNTIRNSHDIVAHWMVQMNTFTGILLSQKKVGIFKLAAYLDTDIDTSIKTENLSNLNDETVRVIKSWNNTVGQYVLFNEETNFHPPSIFPTEKSREDLGNPLLAKPTTYFLQHTLIRNKVAIHNSAAFHKNGEPAPATNMYVHITSPIRRLVDLLNQIILFDQFSLVTQISSDARKFLEYWITQMEYINTSMRYIRKIQTSCQLLSHCFQHPELMEKQHKGVVFDKTIKNDGFITYMVYLQELKILSRVTTQSDVPNYSYQNFNMYLFEDEDKIKKKIRLQIIDL